MDTRQPAWRKSSRCGTNTCVEVAPDGDRVLMRDGKNPGQAPLAIPGDQWVAFVAGIQAGNLDDL